MSNNDEISIPYYAIHKDGEIRGFFGQFRFLSNFYTLESGVVFEELCYPSVEAAYQAAKWPYNKRTQFLDITASESKKLGRESPNFNSKKWNNKKLELMRTLVYQKFEKNILLRKMLLATDGYILDERNSWNDTFWGTDLQGNGNNNLGKILMAVREKFLEFENKEKYW